MRVVFLAAGLLFAQTSRSQDTPESPKVEPQNETFSGNITDLSEGRITVERSILGGSAQKRTFVIKRETRIEGKLRMKAKVTVGYIATDEGDVARLIVVRGTQKR